MAARRFLPSLSCLAILVATTVASADQGQVVLVGGKVLVGDIQEVAKGDYIIIRLENGDVKAIAWADVVWFGFGGAAIAGSGGWTEQPPPPGPVYQPPGPMVVYTPQPWYPAPPPPPPPPPRMSFVPTWTFGARVGTMFVGGNVYGHDYDSWDNHNHGPRLRMADVASWGWMVEGDLGYHFSPSWTVYGFWEHGELDHGDLNAGSSWGHTNAVGIGINANTLPYGPVGFYLDVGAAYRWMEFAEPNVGPDATTSNRMTVEGFDFLRVAVGVSIRLGRHFRLDPNIYSSYGYFTRFRGSACPGGCSIDSQGIDIGGHALSGLAVSGHWDL
ncbi:MAG: hypothetical protein ACXVEE_25070 [Polyangiales bacterium]